MRKTSSLPELLPETGPGEVAVADGAVCAQVVKGGKPNCKCARGELHGPYFYRFTRDQYGRLHKQYAKARGGRGVARTARVADGAMAARQESALAAVEDAGPGRRLCSSAIGVCYDPPTIGARLGLTTGTCIEIQRPQTEIRTPSWCVRELRV